MLNDSKQTLGETPRKTAIKVINPSVECLKPLSMDNVNEASSSNGANNNNIYDESTTELLRKPVR
jgi:hypothetical protein